MYSIQRTFQLPGIPLLDLLTKWAMSAEAVVGEVLLQGPRPEAQG